MKLSKSEKGVAGPSASVRALDRLLRIAYGRRIRSVARSCAGGKENARERGVASRSRERESEADSA